MITHEFGVKVTATRREHWPGLLRVILDMRWETEPGWITLKCAAPGLCLVLGETGGRSEIRSRPEEPPQGEYFGTGHLSFVAHGQPLTVYAREMRDARIGVYHLDLDATDCLSREQTAVVANADSRYMFRDDRLHECARLLGEHEMQDDPGTYGLALAHALQLSLPDALLRRMKSRMSVRLTGERFAKVLAHINDHLDQNTTVKDLAEMSSLSPTQFGQSFQDATGMSVQRWQMDARIRSAQRLMVDDPGESLAEVAALVGFSDSSHFSRAFLEIVGTTPSAWLRQRS
jgi:AraC-like DNA-binding protein